MVTTNVKSYLNEPDDPLERWDPEEINNEKNRISNYISNSIPQNLVSSDTNQTITGQKFFKHLYFTRGNSPSYETVMQSLDNDISPVFGTGAKAIVPESLSDFQIKKGYFTSSNVSGIKMPLAKRNPVFIKSNISIKSSDGSNIEVIAKNVPLASFDNFKAGTPPSLSDSSISSVDYPTSVSFSGTVNKSTIIGSLADDSPVYIILAKKDDETITCLLVVAGNEGSIDTSYTMFKKIGFCYSCDLINIVPFIISDGVFIPGTYNGYNLSLTVSDFSGGTQNPVIHNKNLNSILRETCIISIRTDSSSTTDGSQSKILVNSNTYFTFETTLTNSGSYTQNNIFIKLPMIYSNNNYYSASIPLTLESYLIILDKIEFGGLL
jgi:hypothetical protein